MQFLQSSNLVSFFAISKVEWEFSELQLTKQSWQTLVDVGRKDSFPF